MSSDSEDDCYGNIAQKLHSIKSKYAEDKIKTTNLLCDSTPVSSLQNADKPIEIDGDELISESNTTINSLDSEENILDIIIASNSKKRKSKAISSDISATNILPERASRRKRGRPSAKSPKNSQNSDQITENANIGANVDVSTQCPNQSADASTLLDTSLNATGNTTRGSRRGRGRARGRGRGSNASRGASNQTIETSNTTLETSNTTLGTSNTNLGSSNITSAASNTSRGASNTTIRASNRSRRTSNTPRRNRRQWGWFPSSWTNLSPAYPMYSVGNTDEYPDECDNQALFSKPTTTPNDVQIIEDTETEVDNEELSVKVYWQNSEYIKFNIRKYQKLTPIFEFFSQREKVCHEKLFFTYNDKILKSSDTPDSISYSIAKFIDGGIINQNVSEILKNTDNIKDGIVIKFQCQTKKTPFVTNLAKDDPLLVAMTKCAENLEQPVSTLKFYFDGDLISGKNTPSELELEGGECIDVKIIS